MKTMTTRRPRFLEFDGERPTATGTADVGDAAVGDEVFVIDGGEVVSGFTLAATPNDGAVTLRLPDSFTTKQFPAGDVFSKWSDAQDALEARQNATESRTYSRPAFRLLERGASPTRLYERTNGRVGTIDRAAGVIHNVRILGRESSNGRRYTPKAMSDAATLYEGVRVYIGHSTRERTVGEQFGVLRNCRVDGDAVKGDLHFIRSHPLAEQICEQAERFPLTLGMSHDAEGSTRRESDGVLTVEGLARVHSVDLVTVPATNAGLFESHHSPALRESTGAMIVSTILRHRQPEKTYEQLRRTYGPRPLR